MQLPVHDELPLASGEKKYKVFPFSSVNTVPKWESVFAWMDIGCVTGGFVPAVLLDLLQEVNRQINPQ